jgi:hypothetical protein
MKNMSPTDAEIIDVLRVTARRCRRSDRSLAVGERYFEFPNGRTELRGAARWGYLFPR